jgi:hypothetical protein
MRWFFSVAVALSFSASLMERFFHLLDRPLAEQALLMAVATVGFGILVYQVYPRFEAFFRAANLKIIPVVQAILAGLVFVLLRPSAPATDFISLGLLGFASILPFISGYDYILNRQHVYSIVVSSLMAAPLAFFAAGFLSHSYPNYLTAPISILCLLAAGLISYTVLRYVRNLSKTRLSASTFGLLSVTLALLFALALAALVLRYPNIFDRARFLLEPDSAALFISLSFLAPAWLSWTLKFVNESGWLARWQSTRAWVFVRGNLAGLVLGGIFFLGYTVLSYTFNHPGLDQTENFLAIDNFAWMMRLADVNGVNTEMRAVHPFAFFILRPVVWLLSLLFNGDRYTATLLLVPLTGGLCVFLAYLFIKKWSGSGMYAILTASLLGVSTTQLVFGSFVESYIFSAAVLLLFFVLLLEEKTHRFALVAVSVMTFGITITNFIQTFIGYAVARPKFKSIFMFGLLASALSIALTVLHAAVFPSALMFFDPAGAGVESDYSIQLIGAPAWRVVGRAMLLVRSIFLYSVVAPRPFILTEEVGGVFPRFNFFKLTPGNFSYSSYDGLGTALVLIWASLLLAAGLAFLWKLIRARKLDLTVAFPLVILFNFGLHMTYGYEPFLYAADWTYALVLFVATSLSDFGKRRWFQIILLVFVALLMINQWNFIQTMLAAISPFFK